MRPSKSSRCRLLPLRFAGPVLAAALAFTSPAHAAEPVKGGSFTVLINRDIEGFDHLRAPSPETARIQVLFAVHDLLFRYHPKTGELTPRLALKATPNADFTEWQVTLRPGVRFSNGEELTAEAYSRHFTRLLESPLAAQFRAVLGLPLRSVTAPDKSTILFSFGGPAYAFDVMMGQPLYVWYLNEPGFAAQNASKPDYNTMSVGAGPYMLKSWVPGTSVTLVRNPHYWNPSEQSADELVYKIVTGPERGGLWSALRAGDADAGFTAGDLVGWGRGQSDLTFLEGYRGYAGVLVNFNASKPPFDDVNVRRALAHAINRKAVVDIATRGSAVVADQAFSPDDKWHCGNIAYPEYSVAKAKELLKAYGKPLPKIELWTISGIFQASAEAVQNMWREAGVQSEIKVIGPGPAAMFSAIARGEPPAWVILGSLAAHPTMFHMNLHSTAPGNFWHIKSDKIDRAVEAVQAARSDEAVKQAHCSLEQAKADDVPYIYLTYGVAGVFLKKDVAGVPVPYSGFYDLNRMQRVKP